MSLTINVQNVTYESIKLVVGLGNLNSQVVSRTVTQTFSTAACIGRLEADETLTIPEAG